MIDSRSAALAALVASIAILQAERDRLSNPWLDVDATGATDATDAFQAALDKTGTVPAGRYLIDAEKGVVIRAGSTVVMDPEAILVVKPNGAQRYACISVQSSATLKGGQVVGDRLSHDYSAVGTHEWGYGVWVAGEKATVDGVRVSDCTGDGLGVVGDEHRILNVVSTRNRRQGLSVFSSSGLRVANSEFSNTGAIKDETGMTLAPGARTAHAPAWTWSRTAVRSSTPSSSAAASSAIAPGCWHGCGRRSAGRSSSPRSTANSRTTRTAHG